MAREHGAQRAPARARSTAAPVGFWPRGVAMTARAPPASARVKRVRHRARGRRRGPARPQPERVHEVGDPRPARVLDDDAVAGPSWVCSTRSIASSAPPVIAMSPSIPSAAKSASRERRRARAASRRRRTACAPGRARRAPRPSGGSSAGSGLPLARSRTPGGQLGRAAARARGGSGATASRGRGRRRRSRAA